MSTQVSTTFQDTSEDMSEEKKERVGYIAVVTWCPFEGGYENEEPSLKIWQPAKVFKEYEEAELAVWNFVKSAFFGKLVVDKLIKGVKYVDDKIAAVTDHAYVDKDLVIEYDIDEVELPRL